MQSREHTLMVGAFGLAAVALAGAALGHLPWPLGGTVGALSLGGGVWLHRRMAPAAPAAAAPQVDGSLRMVTKSLPGRPRLPHGLRVTVSTEVAVAHGLRVACTGAIGEAEALVQIGRGANARQGVPAAVRDGAKAWLFAVRNSAGARELFLRVDLFAAQPIAVERVEQVRADRAAALPEWKEPETALAAPSAAVDAPPPVAAPATPATPETPETPETNAGDGEGAAGETGAAADAARS